MTELRSHELSADHQVINAMTVDVEDYFHVSGFEDVVRREDWDAFPSRVEMNTRRLLPILADHSVKATFFVLGWVAERFPHVVKEIHVAGHEIGCHSYWHRLVYEQTPAQFQEDTHRAKAILEDITGGPVLGYRAPSYSIVRQTPWAFDVLAEEGFSYDSSVYPILRDRYGIPGAPRFPYRVALGNGQPILGRARSIPGSRKSLKQTSGFPALAQELNNSTDSTDSIVEIPPSTIRILGIPIPVGGGGYLRLFPERFTHWAIRRVNRREGMPVVSYIHPWELDPDQPRLRGGQISTLRHYVNLQQTESRLRSLLRQHRFRPIRDLVANFVAQGGWRR